MLPKGFCEMSQSKLCRRVGLDSRWLAQGAQSRSDGDLSTEESSPDAIGSRVTQRALQHAKGLDFVSRVCCVGEKLPKAIGTEEQVFDSISGPEAEGSSASDSKMSVGAEDTNGARSTHGIT